MGISQSNKYHFSEAKDLHGFGKLLKFFSKRFTIVCSCQKNYHPQLLLHLENKVKPVENKA